MYNRTCGFLAQEFSDSPDVVEMIVGLYHVIMLYNVSYHVIIDHITQRVHSIK